MNPFSFPPSPGSLLDNGPAIRLSIDWPSLQALLAPSTDPRALFTQADLICFWECFSQQAHNYPLSQVEVLLLCFEQIWTDMYATAEDRDISLDTLVKASHSLILYHPDLQSSESTPSGVFSRLLPKEKRFQLWYNTILHPTPSNLFAHLAWSTRKNSMVRDCDILLLLMQTPFNPYGFVSGSFSLAIYAFADLKHPPCVQRTLLALFQAGRMPLVSSYEILRALVRANPTPALVAAIRQRIMSQDYMPSQERMIVGRLLDLPAIAGDAALEEFFTSTTHLQDFVPPPGATPQTLETLYANLLAPLLMGIRIYPRDYPGRLRIILAHFAQLPSTSTSLFVYEDALLTIAIHLSFQLQSPLPLGDSDIAWFYTTFLQAIRPSDMHLVVPALLKTYPITALPNTVKSHILAHAPSALRPDLFAALRSDPPSNPQPSKCLSWPPSLRQLPSYLTAKLRVH